MLIVLRTITHSHKGLYFDYVFAIPGTPSLSYALLPGGWAYVVSKEITKELDYRSPLTCYES